MPTCSEEDENRKQKYPEIAMMLLKCRDQANSNSAEYFIRINRNNQTKVNNLSGGDEV